MTQVGSVHYILAILENYHYWAGHKHRPSFQNKREPNSMAMRNLKVVPGAKLFWYHTNYITKY